MWNDVLFCNLFQNHKYAFEDNEKGNIAIFTLEKILFTFST